MKICNLSHACVRFRQADLVLNPFFRRTVDMLDFAARCERVVAGIHAVRAQRETISELLAPEAVPSMLSGARPPPPDPMRRMHCPADVASPPPCAAGCVRHRRPAAAWSARPGA